VSKIVMAVLLLLPAVAAAQSEPNLQATIDFMDQMVRPEGRQLALVSNCEVIVESFHKIESWLYIPSQKGFMVADDTDFELKEGESPFPRYMRFNLADVDATTIGSHTSGFSSSYVKRFYDQHPGVCKVEDDECQRQRSLAFDLQFADQTVAFFRTADLKPAIERGVMTKSSSPTGTQYIRGYDLYKYTAKVQTDRVGLDFGDQDRAQRFVTALVHAVSLCGGQGSMFAPTPTKE
jgi:hypothetical protein